MNKISLLEGDILSLFDGMSCGQISLNDLYIPYNKYYASETDKYAMKVTNVNFSDTIQLGDINKWKTWNIDWKNIKLILAGSPCQGFSFAGKQLNFNDPRSALFFVFVDILNHVKKLNPEVKYLLENVRMKKEYLRIISEHVEMFPVNINSNLVSAQNRNRFYWTNIKTKKIGLFEDELVSDIPQPEDKGILLKDILQPENEVDEKYYLKEKTINSLINWGKINKAAGNGFKPEFKTGEQKSTALTTGSMKSSSTFIKLDKQGNKKADQNKAACLTGGGNSGGNPENSNDRRTGSPTEQRLEPKTDGKTNCLTSVEKDNLILIGGLENGIFKKGKTKDFSQGQRIYSPEGKSTTINALGGGQGAKTGLYKIDYKLRRLTPIECERLQTVPDNFTNHVSDSQRYKMLGNGMTVDIISCILKFLK